MASPSCLFETPSITASRLSLLGLVMCGLLVLLLSRLWFLQLEEGANFRERSERNRLHFQRIPAVRGKLYDRLGRTLVDNQPSFDVVFRPEYTPDVDRTLDALAGYLSDGHILPDERPWLNDSRRPANEGVVVARDIDWPVMLAVESYPYALPGISLEARSKRAYARGNLAAHLLGYVGEVSRRELEQSADYRQGDIIGKFGVEKTWDAALRGRSGGRQLEVNAGGKHLATIEEVPAQTGHSLVLTIDLDLQQEAEDALGGRPGAVVALDVSTGEVLALASAPTFDPNVFARGIRDEEWHALRDDQLHPLTNRAIQGQYPPASTFKLISAAAALSEGVVTPDTRVYCPGSLRVAGRRFRCWRQRGHGSVDLHRALAESCDVYFYQIGRQLGIQTLADYARRFGLDEPLGIGLAYEAGGIMPDPAWKQRQIGGPWYLGETISVVIGQGYVTATPLQIAAVAAAVANGGTVYRPYLVRQVIATDGRLVKSQTPHIVRQTGIAAEHLQVITDGMIDVVHQAYGTGKRAQTPSVRVAGKTGTAQAISGRGGSSQQVPRHFRDHAWFVAFAPADAPQIAVVCLLEHAGVGGGKAAAPVAQKVLSAYFSLARQRKDGAGV